MFRGNKKEKSMLVKSLVQSPYLKFVVETLLKTANPRGEPYFKETHFNKMIFLLYKRLKNKGIDIKLPYSWYHYGTFIDPNEFERRVGVPYSYYFSEDGSTRAIDDVSSEGIPFKITQIVREESDDLIQEFRDNGHFKRDYLNLLLDCDYLYVPFEFQRAFNRDFIFNLNLFKTYNISKEEVEIYLDRLIKTYPYADTHELYDTFLEWEDTFRLALMYYNPTRISELAKEFWLIYSELLHIKKNENISEDIVESWSFRFNEIFDEYHMKLEQQRHDLLQIYNERHKSNEEVQRIVKEMNSLAYELAVKR